MKKKSKKKRRVNASEDEEPLLIEMPLGTPEPKVMVPLRPVWTENKAKLIERYLYYFVLITHHGTYIDGFAGPQSEDALDGWAAKLVLESQPAWLRHFYLYDNNKEQYRFLKTLKAAHDASKRDIRICASDFNESVSGLLASGQITEREATFCLLDQRTFECHWSTVEVLARYKTVGHKIELFYFFCNAWWDRAFVAQKDKSVIEKWWGRDDWNRLRELNPWERVRVFCDRLRDDLGYKSAKPWEIYESQASGKIMYFMVHATDHPFAPGLMARAYRKAVREKEPPEQLTLLLSDFPAEQDD